MIVTTNGGQIYEVTTPDEVIALLSDRQSVTQPIHRTREQLLATLADLAEEADRSDCLMLSAALLTVLNASRYPNATKSHLISLGQHMVAACEPLQKWARRDDGR